MKMIVDDGDDDNHPYGNISGLTVVSATKGYFIAYAGWGDNALYSFNVDDSDKLWVASNTFAGGGVLTIINSSDGTVDQVQSLNLNPQGIAFGTWE